MRPYPLDSAEAAARVVALVLTADGGLGDAELAALRRHDVARRLGLTPVRLHAVLNAFCEDLLDGRPADWRDGCRFDDLTIRSVLAHIEDPALRVELLLLAIALVEADGEIGPGEETVLVTAVEQWGLHALMLARSRVPADAALRRRVPAEAA